jgi:hypothetical protein
MHRIQCSKFCLSIVDIAGFDDHGHVARLCGKQQYRHFCDLILFHHSSKKSVNIGPDDTIPEIVRLDGESQMIDRGTADWDSLVLSKLQILSRSILSTPRACVIEA